LQGIYGRGSKAPHTPTRPPHYAEQYKEKPMSDYSTNPVSAEDTIGDANYKVTATELRQFVERIERLDAEKKDLAEQQKEVMAEAKGRGYDTKILRKIIALRKREPNDIAEEEAVLDMYKEALGMS
jgi:uncharacterized protein (UPF0335 family)